MIKIVVERNNFNRYSWLFEYLYSVKNINSSEAKRYWEKINLHRSIFSIILQVIKELIIKIIIIPQHLSLFRTYTIRLFSLYHFSLCFLSSITVSILSRYSCLTESEHICESELTYPITIRYLTFSFTQFTSCIKLISNTAGYWRAKARCTLLLGSFKISEGCLC